LKEYTRSENFSWRVSDCEEFVGFLEGD